MRNHLTLQVLLAAALSGLVCSAAWAGPTWICAIARATACEDDGTTGEPDLGGLERPTFLRVDVDAKRVTILGPAGRRGEVSKIDTVQRGEECWLLTGAERGRAWSIVISDEGHLTISMTGDGVVWAVFGHAILEQDLAKGGPPAVKAKAEPE